MAFFFTINQTPSNWVGCMMQLWQTMVNAGWLVLSWSDGSVGGGSTHGSPGAGFLGFSTNSLGIPVSTAATLGSANNPGAWILMQQPTSSLSLAPPYGGTRQLTFQLSYAGTRTDWRIKYSFSGGFYPSPAFTGSVTATPSSSIPADEVILRGGGTDTVPTFNSMFSNNGTYEGMTRANCMADDGTGPSGSQPNCPFSFLSFGLVQGGLTSGMSVVNSVNYAFMFDAMQVGTATPNNADIDPFIFYNDFSGFPFENNLGGAPTWTRSSLSTTSTPRGWSRRGQTNQTFTNYQAMVPHNFDNGSTQNLLGVVGGNHITGADELMVVIYTRSSADGGLTGYKGISSLVRWNGTLRQNGDTLSFSQPGFSRDRIIVGQCSVPWDGSTVPIV
jgi:hypothetical protein